MAHRQSIHRHVRGRAASFQNACHYTVQHSSGSTKQQLTGIALSEFIMQKTGVRWEDVTVDDITVDDLDDESFKIFRREALRKKRMTETELNISNSELLQKLHLIKDGKLKRSAVLLFYSDPSIVQNGSFIKIGKFDEKGRVTYHHDLEESLLVNASKVIDLIYLMYLKAKISYEHDRRVEEYPFAREAIREAIYNAIAHNCYMYGAPIQIRIADDSITISNSCILPDSWTVETLMEPHDSKPYNPDIANVFYRAGFIENWGQGIQKMCDACKEIGADLPVYELRGNDLRIHFKALERALIDHSKVPKGQSEPLTEPKANLLSEKIIQLLRNNPRITYGELTVELELSRSTIKRTMNRLVVDGLIERVGGKRYGYWKIND